MLDLFCKSVPFPPGYTLRVCYVAASKPFPEIESFIKECEEGGRYDEQVGGMKGAFKSFLSQFPQIRAIFVGVRRTDPYCSNLLTIQETDNGWPYFFRIHPILDWSYKEIWQYLKLESVPYCKLYDEGYTSIGGMDNTKPNPHLMTKNGTFLPAFMLEHEECERAGRIKSN